MKYGEGLDYAMLALDSENFKEFFDPAGLAADQASVPTGLITVERMDRRDMKVFMG